ncbi:hypothetical protein [Phenylobacterium sp. SCN 70-31]|uniref:hypothetical protein n=1 Tax=Phenylobacterium sp. SCN 70-31 TaxID=1660129 RepID=UPI000868AD77|nr:hypothetical protein [Phenylobacterium sp. SCN 70-31]ODT84765.1 MAG: hypothetical protein ABS78_22215 [Phenylobacterium sp. SCN 70-31]
MGKLIGRRRAASDHFEPDEDVDPKAQRNLRGHLEHIDYTAYAANKKLLTAAMGALDGQRVQKLAAAAALARTRWVVAALTIAEDGATPTREQIAGLTHLRSTYDELASAYDGLRRMVERGYIGYAPAAD